MRERLTSTVLQLQPEAIGQRLTSLNNLISQVKTFLIACKVEELSPATLYFYDYRLQSLLSFCSEHGIYDARDFTADLFREYLIQLQDRLSKIGVSGYYKTVKRFFNWLEEEGVFENSPISKVKMRKPPEKIIEPFTDNHVKAMLGVLDASCLVGARNIALILTFTETGLRLSEMAVSRMWWKKESAYPTL